MGAEELDELGRDGEMLRRLRSSDSGRPESVSNPSPFLAAVISEARNDSASAMVRNDLEKFRLATAHRTR